MCVCARAVTGSTELAGMLVNGGGKALAQEGSQGWNRRSGPDMEGRKDVQELGSRKNGP